LKYLLITPIVFLLSVNPLTAQEIGDVDEAFQNAGELTHAGEYELDRFIISEILEISPEYPEDADLRENLHSDTRRYAFSASYTYDHFSEVYDSWHSGYLQLSGATSIGTWITRVNTANRFDETGFQPEIDFYPEFGDGWYGYLNIGYSPSNIYPEFRYGAELYTSLPANLEISAGARHLRYPHDNITFFTGSLTGYFGNWMLTARPYFTPSDIGVSRSFNFFFRRYLADADNYITLRGGFGFSPEERTFQTGLDEIFLTESRFIGIEAQKSFTNRVLGFIIFDFSRQEFLFNPDNFYSRYSIQTRLEYRF
jgi:YaiO family outer membrane protein